MAILLTDSAAAHVRRMLDRHEGSIGVRFGTRRGGCSGFAYVVDYVDRTEAGDAVFETAGVTVVVDGASLPHLDGMTVDYVKNGLFGEALEFINPNVSSACGCGESVDFGKTA